VCEVHTCASPAPAIKCGQITWHSVVGARAEKFKLIYFWQLALIRCDLLPVGLSERAGGRANERANGGGVKLLERKKFPPVFAHAEVRNKVAKCALWALFSCYLSKNNAQPRPFSQARWFMAEMENSFIKNYSELSIDITAPGFGLN
jgi:hypothetical protein